jgi:hypothetical protein
VSDVPAASGGGDAAQELDIPRGERVAVVVLLGEGAAVAAELTPQLRILAQSFHGLGELVATFGLDQQRTA